MLINQSVKYAASDPLSAVFMALADPTRRQILSRLRQGEATVTELAQPFTLSLPAVSKHLKVLERAGLIKREQRAQWRPCQLDAQTLKAVADWTDQYRAMWEGSLENLDNYLQTLTKKEQ